MPDQVKVENLEVFTLLRAALMKFAQAAEQSLFSADSTIARTRSWLENEQTTYWQAQHRKRTEAVAQAKEALRLKKLYKDAAGRIPDAVEEQKILARALAALEQADQKILAIRKAIPRVEKESDLYRSGVSRLGGTLSVELPKAIALVDRLALNLEEYIQIEAPASAMPDAAVASEYEGSISRGGEAAETPPVAGAPIASPKAEVSGKEAPHVVDGQ